MSKTFKNLINGGYTTHHSDGSKSTTFKNLTDSGYTTYHDNGSKSVTYQNITDSGFTTHDISNHQTGGFNDGGLLDVPCLVFGATIILVAILSLFTLGKSAIFALLLIAVSVLVRGLLNRKYDTGFFSLWAHPFTLLGWRLLVNALWQNTTFSFMAVFGIFFLSVGILVSFFWDCGSFGMFFYEFVTLIFMVFMKAYGEYAPYWMLAVMWAIAVIATIVVTLKRQVTSQPNKPVQNSRSYTSAPKTPPVSRPQVQPMSKPQTKPAPKPPVQSEKQQQTAETIELIKAYKTLIREMQNGHAEYEKQKAFKNDMCPCGSGKKYKDCCGAGK